MAGTNDINNNDNVDTAPDRLSALIDQIVSACPDAAVLVAQIIANGNADAENRVIDFNNQVVRVAMEHYAAGNKVWPVDMSRIDDRELQDGLHPTNDGYFRMAQNWFYAIKQANSFGWIQQPVAGSSRPGGVYCDHNPTWIPQGEIANGAGFGANGDETECTV
jgi:lysophospholipase L1-like esterase